MGSGSTSDRTWDEVLEGAGDWTGMLAVRPANEHCLSVLEQFRQLGRDSSHYSGQVTSSFREGMIGSR